MPASVLVILVVLGFSVLSDVSGWLSLLSFYDPALGLISLLSSNAKMHAISRRRSQNALWIPSVPKPGKRFSSPDKSYNNDPISIASPRPPAPHQLRFGSISSHVKLPSCEGTLCRDLS